MVGPIANRTYCITYDSKDIHAVQDCIGAFHTSEIYKIAFELGLEEWLEVHQGWVAQWLCFRSTFVGVAALKSRQSIVNFFRTKDPGSVIIGS